MPNLQPLLEELRAVLDGKKCQGCGGKGWYIYIKCTTEEEVDTGLSMGCSACGGSGGEADLVKGTGFDPAYDGLREAIKSFLLTNPNA
ncbi:hypothetical protein LCGC14_1622030 [marine sediment metagenome]|uniref:Uncharacterized protein n=1 Tax=marine sediment metagenome TaxID=412755 RepID=A0A0F9IS81_9ZZZZ